MMISRILEVLNRQENSGSQPAFLMSASAAIADPLL
jgi:hypothetical protein